jgi:hypothetical protein
MPRIHILLKAHLAWLQTALTLVEKIYSSTSFYYPYIIKDNVHFAFAMERSPVNTVIWMGRLIA